MDYIIITFPFKSFNDGQYKLVLALNSSDDLSGLVSELVKDERQFLKPGLTDTSASRTVYHFEGTLTGNVRATDDERSDMYTPLVTSKLRFNMAVTNFPNWLMQFCTTRRAKLVLYYDDGLKHEMWRGYLIDQALSLTVVNDKLSVPLVAVDEVAMAKYLKFKPSIGYLSNERWSTLFGLMEYYNMLHYERGMGSGLEGFETLYQIVGLTSTKRMLWHRNLRITDDTDEAVNDIPSTFVVNFDRWLQNEESTWEEVFNELFAYLGVTFAIGSYGAMSVNDVYLLTNPTDPVSIQQFVYTFGNHSITTHSYDVYATLPNPVKVGANLQVTAEPDRYKAVKVTSKPERWETHDYLTEEHYKEIGDNSVKFAWGTTDDPSNGPFTEYGWNKLKYIKPDAKEADYLSIAPCADGEGLTMARNGELPYDDLDSCAGKTEPDESCAGSLDFITFKEGVCCIRMGSGTLSGVDEDKLLKPYFLVMNHMWGTMVNHANHVMGGTHVADTAWLTLRPLGMNGAAHPGDKHYLRIAMDVMFIRENFPIGSTTDGDPHMFNWFRAPGVGQGMQVVNWTSPAMIMPTDKTVFDFETDAGPYHGAYNGSLTAWNSLYFTAYIHIGRHYFNGSSWVYVAAGQTPPKCNVTMRNSTTKTAEIDKFGYYSLETANYYYTISNPSAGNNTVERNNENAMLIDMDGQSAHGTPVQGVMEMEVLGQVHFQSTHNGVGQSVPFLLMSGIDINYTDDAEFVDADLSNKVEMVMDAASTSKETLERELDMATPSAAGFFNNALLYDGGKTWHNVTQVLKQNLSTPTTLEAMQAEKLRDQYSTGQMFVELTTPIQYDDNVHNVCFRVTSLTEAGGTFVPVKRDFDYNLERMRVKLMRVNTFSAVV